MDDLSIKEVFTVFVIGLSFLFDVFTFIGRRFFTKEPTNNSYNSV